MSSRPPSALIGIFVLLPMPLTIWLSFHDWSTQTPFGTATLRRARTTSATSSDRRRSAATSSQAMRNTAVYTALSVAAHPAAVGGVRAARPPARGAGARAAARHPLFHLHGADDRGRAGVVEALLADRRAAEPDPRRGSASRRQPWLSSPDTALLLDRAAQRLAAGRLFHRARGRRADANSRQPSTRPRRSTAPMRWQQFRAITLPLMRRTLLFSAVIAIINAVQVFEPVALITQGGPGRLDQRAHLPHPPRRHRARAGRPGLGDGGDADAGADRGRSARVFAFAATGRTR